MTNDDEVRLALATALHSCRLDILMVSQPCSAAFAACRGGIRCCA